MLKEFVVLAGIVISAFWFYCGEKAFAWQDCQGLSNFRYKNVSSPVATDFWVIPSAVNPEAINRKKTMKNLMLSRYIEKHKSRMHCSYVQWTCINMVTGARFDVNDRFINVTFRDVTEGQHRVVIPDSSGDLILSKVYSLTAAYGGFVDVNCAKRVRYQYELLKLIGETDILLPYLLLRVTAFPIEVSGSLPPSL